MDNYHNPGCRDFNFAILRNRLPGLSKTKLFGKGGHTLILSLKAFHHHHHHLFESGDMAHKKRNK